MKVKQLLSRKAGCNSHGQDSSYFLGWQEYEKNPYHHIDNPNGIIQMGLAENQLSFDLLESWLGENPEALTFKQDGKSVFREIALFQDYHGLPAFKHALAEMMSEIRGDKVRFDPNNLVLTAGATSANEALIFTLADPGDAFLVPTPYYPGFDRDLKWRTGVEIVPIECHTHNGFKITQTALEAALKSAHKRNLNVKGVLFTNPSNPLGTTTTRPELHLLLRFAASHDLHLVADEIYAGTAFASPDFISIYDALSELALHDLHGRVHIVTSLSKDLGLPGFRVGAIYSDNKAVVAAATKMSSFGLISSQTQHLLGLMLGDKGFRSGYVAENRRRLRQRHRQLVDGLAGIGIPCLDSNAGLFCWVDMKHLMSSKQVEGEIKLWKEVLYEVGLNISPGSSCHCSEPGWFRVCFANMSEETLGLAIDRLKRFVDGRKRRSEVVHHGFGSKKVVQVLPKWVFRLSSSCHAEPDR